MSAGNDFLEGNFEDDQTGVENPNLVKDLRQQLKAEKQERSQLAERLEAQEKASRQRSIEEVLKNRGVPEKVAGLVPSDVNPDEESVGKWLDEYGDVFGAGQGTGQAQNDGQPPAGMSQEDVAAQQQMSQVQSGASTAGTSAEQQAQRITDPNMTQEQLLEMIQNAKSQGGAL